MRPEKIDPTDIKQALYKIGDENHVFIKSSQFNSTKTELGDNLVGAQSEAQMCVYIDWFNFWKVDDLWSSALLDYIRIVPFDGLWAT